MDASTIRDNTAGGIASIGTAYSGTLLVRNSTISGNARYGVSAGGEDKLTRIESSTIAGNGSAGPAPNDVPNGAGGLIAAVSGSFGSLPPRVQVVNSLIAENSGGDVNYSSFTDRCQSHRQSGPQLGREWQRGQRVSRERRPTRRQRC